MKKTLINLALGFTLSQAAFAQTALEVVTKAHLNSYYQGNDGHAQVLMKIYSKNTKKPIKKLFHMLRLDIEEGGKQMFFTYFVKPSDIKRTTFLVHKFIDKDDYRRLYIPASDKIIPIAGSRKQDPFMGSDFSYEDVSGRHFSKDNHKILREEKVNGELCYVTHSTPKVKEEKISKIIAYISKKSLIPLKAEYYNHAGKIFKDYTSNKIKSMGGFDTIMERVMVSPLENTRTVMVLNPKRVKYNIGLKKEHFSERTLKNPPMQFIKK